MKSKICFLGKTKGKHIWKLLTEKERETARAGFARKRTFCKQERY